MTTGGNYFMVLWDIPKSYTREQVLVYYQSTSTILRFQVLDSVSSSIKKRMGLMQMATAEDLMHCVCRFLNEGETKMRHFISQSQSEVIEQLLRKPSHIRVSFERTSDESLPDKILNLFKKCGNVALLSQHSDGSREDWMLEVDSAYQLGQVCTGTSFMFGATKVQLEFFEDFIEEQEAACILANSEEVVNRLEHYYQGLGLFVKSSVSMLDEDSPQIQTCGDYLEDNKDEILESVFEDEDTDEMEYVFDPAKVCPGLTTHSGSMSSFHSVPVGSPASDLLVPVHGALTCQAELGLNKPLHVAQSIAWQLLTRQPDIEDRILDAVDRLVLNGTVLDGRFIESVESKICAETPKSDKLRAILKIVKTKVRKLKRRDKRKQPKSRTLQSTEGATKPAHDSDDESDDFDPEAKKDQTKNRYKKCSAEDVTVRYQNYPDNWVLFLSQHLVTVEEENNLRLGSETEGSAKPIQPNIQIAAIPPPTEKSAEVAATWTTTVNPNTEGISEWRLSVLASGARDKKPPVGWPDCYHHNLRLNRRKFYGHQFSHPFNFNTSAPQYSFQFQSTVSLQ